MEWMECLEALGLLFLRLNMLANSKACYAPGKGRRSERYMDKKHGLFELALVTISSAGAVGGGKCL